MPISIGAILGSTAFDILARVLLALVLWTSGLAKLIDFGGNAANMLRCATWR